MGLFDFFLRPRRPQITHTNADNFALDNIANDTIFTREGSGLTTVGSMGYNVKLNIFEQSNVIISGNIGAKCKILKDGSGTLTIDGDVARDLKLTISGQGTVYFTRKPHDDVIKSIRRSWVAAEIYCEGVLVPAANPAYTQHNMGRSVPETRVVEVERVIERVVVRNVPVPVASSSRQAPLVKDEYIEETWEYIEGFHRAHPESIATRVEKLGPLSKKEEELLEKFTDKVVTFDYFKDIPVMYNERHYDLSTVHQLREEPLTKRPIKLLKIQPARVLLEEFEAVMATIQLNRQKAAVPEHVEEESTNSSLRM